MTKDVSGKRLSLSFLLHFLWLPLHMINAMAVCLSPRPAFLPDPNDGSLYSLGGKNNEGLTVGATNIISALFFKDGTQ